MRSLENPGKLYGITTEGGANNVGVIFSYDPISTVYAKLMDLDSAGGASSFGSFMQALNGKLYAMTNKGGSNDGQNFKVIAQIRAAAHNSYSYNDPVAGTASSVYYYRLRAWIRMAILNIAW